MPFSAFPEAVKPKAGAAGRTAWYGNFTRHRICGHGLDSEKKQGIPGSAEYTRMNTTYAVPSDNLEDFAPIKFAE